MTFWDNFSKKIHEEFVEHPNDYLRQRNIQKAVCSHDSRYINKLWSKVKDKPELRSIADPHTGKPHMFHGGYTMSTLRSFVYIELMRKYFDLDSVEHVFDFGAGYGNFARIFNTLYSPEHYTSIDLPVMQEMQKSYLQDQDFVVQYTQYDKEITPKGKSLFFATFSLCECDRTVQDTVASWIDKFDYVFIAHRDNFNNHSNMEYFNGLKDKLNGEHVFDQESAKWWLICQK